VAIAILGQTKWTKPLSIKLGSFPKNRKQNFYLCMILSTYVFASWRKQRRGKERCELWGITKCKQIFPCVYYTLVSRNFVLWVLVKKEGCTIEKLLKNDWALCIVNKPIWMNEVLFGGAMGSISLSISHILWGLGGASHSLNNTTLMLNLQVGSYY